MVFGIFFGISSWFYSKNCRNFYDILRLKKYDYMHEIKHILENVVRGKYFQAGVHIDGSGRTTQTLEHVVVVQILILDLRESQIDKYSEVCWR